jgi:hypothetical protein
MKQDLRISYQAKMSETIKGRRRYVDTFCPCHKFSTDWWPCSRFTLANRTLLWQHFWLIVATVHASIHL